MSSGGRPTDDLIPPAKKRISDRQITKDDAEEESDAEVGCTYKIPHPLAARKGNASAPTLGGN